MASLNKVLLMGNLTRNPEIRYTPSGSAVCEFGMAINRRFMQANGQERDETCFVDIVVWGKQAESTSRFLQKGSSVFIEGRLVYDQWEEKDTQKKRSRLRVNADRVQFLDRRDDRAGGEMPPDGGQPADIPSITAVPRGATAELRKAVDTAMCRRADMLRGDSRRVPSSIVRVRRRRLRRKMCRRCRSTSPRLKPWKASTTIFLSD